MARNCNCGAARGPQDTKTACQVRFAFRTHLPLPWKHLDSDTCDSCIDARHRSMAVGCFHSQIRFCVFPRRNTPSISLLNVYFAVTGSSSAFLCSPNLKLEHRSARAHKAGPCTGENTQHLCDRVKKDNSLKPRAPQHACGC